MKLVKKKWLALVLAVVMLVGTFGMSFSVGDAYYDMFTLVNNKYLSKVTSADVTKLIGVLGVLKTQKSALANEIKNNLNADSKDYLERYGFTNAKIDTLLDWSQAQAETLLIELADTATGNEANPKVPPTYADYETLMKSMTAELWALLPDEFKSRISEYAADEEALMALMYEITNTFITSSSKIGVAKGIDATKYSLTLDATTDLVKVTEIVTAVETKTGKAVSSKLVNAMMATADQILDLLEGNFKDDQNAIALLIKYDLVKVEAYVAPPTGGGGPIIMPPVLPPVVDPAPTPEAPVGTPNPDASYTSLPMREANQLLNAPVVTPAQVDPVLESLKKEALSGQQDIVETLQIVDRAAELIEKLMDNTSLSNEDAVKYVNQILTQFIVPATQKDAAGATHHELDALASELVEMVLERVGTIASTGVVTDAMVKAAAAAQAEALEALKESLSKALSTSEIAALSRNVSVEVTGTSVKVDPAAVAYMKESGLGIRVDSGTVHMTLTSDIIKTLRADQNLVVDLSPKSTNGLSTTNGGSKVVVGGAYKLSVTLTNAQGTVTETLSKIQPIVSLPLGGFRTGLHTVGAYYYNETTEAWEYIRSQVINNRVVFKAPHLSVYGVLQREVSFTDMTAHWAKNVVEELAAHNIVSGRTATEYAPNGTITRAEFATLLVQALQLKGDVKVTFNDVYEKDWYYQYVNVAALHGLVSGVGGGKFDPNANITRQDMAIMIMKAYEKMLGKSVKSVQVEIKDLPMVSAYAKDRVLAARFNRLIGGYPDGTFKPLNNATRAEAAQMIKNLVGK